MENIQVNVFGKGEYKLSYRGLSAYYTLSKINMIEKSHRCSFSKYISTITFEQLMFDAAHEVFSIVLTECNGTPQEVTTLVINLN